jgi:hypothetical protein
MADRKTVVQVKHRLRRGLLQRIGRSAETKDLSINEEIERRLEESFRREERAELIARALGDTVKLEVRLHERLWRRLEQVAKDNEKKEIKGSRLRPRRPPKRPEANWYSYLPCKKRKDRASRSSTN